MVFVSARASQNHMATTFHFTVTCDQSDQGRVDRLLYDSHQLVEQLENELTEFREVSPIFKLNHAAKNEWIDLSDAGVRLMKTSEAIRGLSQGAFDFTAKSTEGQTSQDRIEIDFENRRARKLVDGAHVGFGAIGKGFALDEVRTFLEREGLEDFVLNAGGSSYVFSGYSEPGVPWDWAWSWQYDQDGTPLGIQFTHESGKPISLGISGTHEKGQHILGVESDASVQPQSALIGTRSATEADALSTALFVSGWDKGNTDLANAGYLDTATAMIDSEGTPFWNGIFQSLWGSPVTASLLFFFLSLGSGKVAFAQDDEDESEDEEDSDDEDSDDEDSDDDDDDMDSDSGDEGMDVDLETGDGAIDLSSLGGGSDEDFFNPYLFDRDVWWVLLPAVSILWVTLHLQKVKRKKRLKARGTTK